MKPGLRAGLVAGAAGTLALDVASYADMGLRGRAASDLPGRAAARLLERFGVSLGGDDDPVTASRTTAVGALLGYGTGIAIGGAFGLVRRGRRRPLLRTGVGLGLTAMALANGPMVAEGLTDPRTWGVSGWISDIVPHVAYGVVAAKVYDSVTR